MPKVMPKYYVGGLATFLYGAYRELTLKDGILYRFEGRSQLAMHLLSLQPDGSESEVGLLTTP